MPATTLSLRIPLSAVRSGRNARGESFEVDDLLDSFGRQVPQLQNIVVRRLPSNPKEFEVISGHRRVEAARRRGWSHIAAVLVDVDDDTAELYALEENLKRKALPDEATALARLLELYKKFGGETHGGDHRSSSFQSNRQGGDLKVSAAARLAKATGLSPRDVQRKARIGRLGTPELRKAFAEGRVGVGEADRLAGFAAADQRRLLETLRGPKVARIVPGLTGDVRRALESMAFIEKVLQRAEGSITGAVVRELDQQLQRVATRVMSLGRATKLAKRPAKAMAKPDVADAVHLELKSANQKLSLIGHSPGLHRPHPKAMKPFVATTTLSIQATCPSSCAFKPTPGEPGGCYAGSGFERILGRKLDAAGLPYTADEVVAEEARQIDEAFGGGSIPQDGANGGRDLRLHIAGDVGSTQGARLLAGAARRWRTRGGGSVWSYSHAWREVPRAAWGDAISVLASVETPEGIEEARKRGYAAAIVVHGFPTGDVAFKLPGSRASIIPCPAETREANCSRCRLCLDRDLLKTKSAIAFKVHGQFQKAASEKLVQLNMHSKK